jgi:hypothetical protein
VDNSQALNALQELFDRTMDVRNLLIGLPSTIPPGPTFPPGRATGGPTGAGGLFLLHPNEWVLSEAQRYGRAPIPTEAVPAAGAAPSGGTNNITINIGAISPNYTPQQAGDDIVNRLRAKGLIV